MRRLKIVDVILAWTSTTVTLLLHTPAVHAASTCDPPIAKMVSVQGNVVVLRAGQTQRQPAYLNETHCPGDRIQVGGSEERESERLA